MSKVYFKKVNTSTSPKEVNQITKELLERLFNEESFVLEAEVPLKVHFGEPGNTTFIKPENFDGIIDFLEERNVKSSFMETLVVYGGRRNTRSEHVKVAYEHGFTRLPIVIADGEHGENFREVEISQKHYKTCKIAGEFEKYKQLIIVAHFKGHQLGGFGGALKQLSMGCAAKGGKLAMHMGIKPQIINRKCIKCKICLKACNVDAITIDEKSYIDHKKCIGCGGCSAVCPQKAISLVTLKGAYRAFFKRGEFREKLIEYALAAQKGKKNIYINFVMNITPGCDCEGKKMKTLMNDIGIFVSTDPVAIDCACYDAVKEKGRIFNGYDQLYYAEKLGLGLNQYRLVELK